MLQANCLRPLLFIRTRFEKDSQRKNAFTIAKTLGMHKLLAKIDVLVMHPGTNLHMLNSLRMRTRTSTAQSPLEMRTWSLQAENLLKMQTQML